MVLPAIEAVDTSVASEIEESLLAGAVRQNQLEPCRGTVRLDSVEASRVYLKNPQMTKRSPFRYFKTSPEIIRLAVMLYVRFPLSLRNVEDLLHERGIQISHETVRFWVERFGAKFAKEIRKKRAGQGTVRLNAVEASRLYL